MRVFSDICWFHPLCLFRSHREPAALNINSKTVLERTTNSGSPKPPGLFAGGRIGNLPCTQSVPLMNVPGEGFPVENVCLPR